MAIGHLLRELRERKGWSARTAAAKLGTSPSRLQDVESGFSRTTGKETKPTIDFLLKAARGYGVPLPGLLESAGMAVEGVDEAQEAEILALFRNLSPRARELAIALLRTVEGQDQRANP